MINFSKPAELVGTHLANDTAGSASMGKCGDNIAVVAWSYYTNAENGSTSWYELYLAAVRYTTSGPEVGPTLWIPAPTVRGFNLNDVVQGRGDEAWLVIEQVDQDSSGVYTYMHRFGRVTVDPETLQVSVEWKFDWPTEYYGYGAVVCSWPEQGLLVMGTNNEALGNTAYPNHFAVLLDMETGVEVAKVNTPPARPAYPSSDAGVTIEAFSFHPDLGKVLLLGTWYDDNHNGSGSTFYIPGAWVADVTPTGFGPWTYLGDLRGAIPGVDYYWMPIRWATATPVPGGWGVLYVNNYYSYRAYWGRVEPLGLISWAPYVSGNVSNYENENYARVFDAVYDSDQDLAVATYYEWYSGMVCQQMPSGGLDSTKDFVPSTASANYISATQCVVVAPGRYLFLILSTGIGRPRSGGTAGTYTAKVWAAGSEAFASTVGGQIGDQVGVPATPTDTPVDKTRRSFRRMH